MSTSTFIEQLYSNFLGRSSDAAGKAYWTEKLDSGAMNAAQISQSFIESEEFSGVVSPVAQLYYATFNRIPDAGGLAYWMEAFQNGSSIEEISNGFVGSQEFQDKYGSAVDDDAFLELLYQNVFNRAPDAEGKANWLNEMNSNGLSRADVLVGFSNSQEQINAKGEDIKIIVQYQGILGTAPTQEQIDTAIATANPESVLTGLYASADYNGEAVPGLSIDGVVVDGYISGATVFIDANGDGIQNEGEVSTTTDEFGNFDFGTDASFGDLVMTGGTDISTGQAFEGTMKAPGGSTVVNPLTTLVDAIQNEDTSTEEAVAAVLASLGLDSDVDLLNYDPIAQVTDSDATDAETEIALAIQAAAIQVNTLISQTAALLDGAGVTDGEDAAIVSAYAALANTLSTATTEVDLSSGIVIEQVIQDAAVEAGADSTQTTEVEALSADASQTISNLNQAIDDAVTNNAGVESALEEIVAIQVVAEDIENDIESGAETGDVSDTTTSTEGIAFAIALDEAKLEVDVIADNLTGEGSLDTPSLPSPSIPNLGSANNGIGQWVHILNHGEDKAYNFTVDENTSELNIFLKDTLGDIGFELYKYDGSSYSLVSYSYDGSYPDSWHHYNYKNNIENGTYKIIFEEDDFFGDSSAQVFIAAETDNHISGLTSFTVDPYLIPDTGELVVKETFTPLLLSGQEDIIPLKLAVNTVNTIKSVSINITQIDGVGINDTTLNWWVNSLSGINAKLYNGQYSELHFGNETVLEALIWSGTADQLADEQFLFNHVSSSNYFLVLENTQSAEETQSDFFSAGPQALSVNITASTLDAVKFSSGGEQYAINPFTSNSFNSNNDFSEVTFPDALDMYTSARTLQFVLGFNERDFLSLYDQYVDAIDGVNTSQTIISAVNTSISAIKSIYLFDVTGLVTGALLSVLAQETDYDGDLAAESVGTFYMNLGFELLREYSTRKELLIDSYNDGEIFPYGEFSSEGVYTEIQDLFYLQNLAKEAIVLGMDVYASHTDISEQSWVDFVVDLLAAAAPVTNTILDTTLSVVTALDSITNIIDNYEVMTAEEIESATAEAWEELSDRENLPNFFSDDAQSNLATHLDGIVFDNTPPNITISNVDISADTGSSDTDFITNVASQTITATLSEALAEGDRLFGSVDYEGNVWTDITDKVTGTAINWDGVTLAGQNDIVFRIIDAVGNVTQTPFDEFQSFELDTVAPLMTYTGVTYNEGFNILQLAGVNINTLLSTGDDSATDIKGNLDWSKLTWNIDGSTPIAFSEGDIVDAQAVSDDTLSITLSDLKASEIESTTGYDALVIDDTVTLEEGFAVDAAGNVATTDAGTYGESTAPLLTASSPSDDAIDVEVDANITLTFNEDIVLGSGNIVLSDDSSSITIDVTNHSNQLSITGSTLTINPTGNINAGKNYNVQMASGVLTDTSGNYYAGISSSTDLNFTTTAEPTIGTSIVVFDLVGGVSSSHSGRVFDANVAYDIYVIFDSDRYSLNTTPLADVPIGANWGIWSNSGALGSDDTVMLVGDNGLIDIYPWRVTSHPDMANVHWPIDSRNDQIAIGGYKWAQGQQVSEFIHILPAGDAIRQGHVTRSGYETNKYTATKIWTGSYGGGSQAVSGQYLVTIPALIMTSQGLV